MKKLISTLFLMSFLFVGCAPSLEQLNGKYDDKPFQIYTSKSKDAVWEKIIEFFATKGISIKLIDRQSGLIISEKTSFINSYTYEDKNGNPIDPKAFVVCGKYVNMYKVMINPETVTGEWNIRIVTENEKTLININLLNLNCSFSTISWSGKSLRNFEKIIADYIK